MVKANLTSVTGETCPLPSTDCSHNSPDEYENVRLLAIGSPAGVNATIRTLYVLGFAQISDWSPLLPAPNSGDVMSILTRRLPRDGGASSGRA
ncbi:MAG: hypothetical protein SWY16_21655 [Cyanobacteriota bacterium]|nr:hypothetical protein [Cyanobacteriota bacterium]